MFKMIWPVYHEFCATFILNFSNAKIIKKLVKLLVVMVKYKLSRFFADHTV